MSYFNKFNKRENLVSRSLDIDEELYSKLEILSQEVIKLYERKNKSYISRSFLIRETLLEGLYNLKGKYRISICLLVNIAIRNALIEEGIITN